MRSRATSGWVVVLGGLSLALAVGCAGRSDRAEAGGGAAGDTQGGKGGGGAEPSGGVAGAPAGGASGTIGTGGSAGACPICPDGDYGLVVEGDGPPHALDYNGIIDAHEDMPAPRCPEQPPSGVVAPCSGSLTFQACEGPANGPSCLEVNGSTARYLDHQTGKLWLGVVASKVLTPSPDPAIATGVLTLEFTDEAGAMLSLQVTYAICAPAANLGIPC